MKNLATIFGIAAVTLALGLLVGAQIANNFAPDVFRATLLACAMFVVGYVLGLATYRAVYGAAKNSNRKIISNY